MVAAGRWAVAIAAATLWTTGCHVDESRRGDGGKDVKIATPFGGMQVNTNDKAIPEQIGLPAYPGAVPEKKEHDSGSADVNLNFGDFQLRVKVASFRTEDAPQKVEAFYRTALARYGDVIACHGEHTIGQPLQTSEGLTCADRKDNTVSLDNDIGDHNLELKAGSRRHQHIVGVDPDGAGTKFAMVMLDLPTRMLSGGSGGGDRE